MSCSLRNACLAALLCGAGFAHAQPATADSFDSRLQQVLEDSRENKRGVYLHVNGGRIAGVVKEVHPDVVVMSSREFERIVVRRDRIEAVESP